MGETAGHTVILIGITTLINLSKPLVSLTVDQPELTLCCQQVQSFSETDAGKIGTDRCSEYTNTICTNAGSTLKPCIFCCSHMYVHVAVQLEVGFAISMTTHEIDTLYVYKGQLSPLSYLYSCLLFTYQISPPSYIHVNAICNVLHSQQYVSNTREQLHTE